LGNFEDICGSFGSQDQKRRAKKNQQKKQEVEDIYMPRVTNQSENNWTIHSSVRNLFGGGAQSDDLTSGKGRARKTQSLEEDGEKDRRPSTDGKRTSTKGWIRKGEGKCYA